MFNLYSGPSPGAGSLWTTFTPGRKAQVMKQIFEAEGRPEATMKVAPLSQSLLYLEGPRNLGD